MRRARRPPILPRRAPTRASVILRSPKATSVLRGLNTNGNAWGLTNQAAPSKGRVASTPSSDVGPVSVPRRNPAYPALLSLQLRPAGIRPRKDMEGHSRRSGRTFVPLRVVTCYDLPLGEGRATDPRLWTHRRNLATECFPGGGSPNRVRARRSFRYTRRYTLLVGPTASRRAPFSSTSDTS